MALIVSARSEWAGTILICDFFPLFSFQWALYFPRVTLYPVGFDVSQ